MRACEKCWGDAYLRSLNTGRSQVECYTEILAEREVSGEICTIEQQRGTAEIDRLQSQPEAKDIGDRAVLESLPERDAIKAQKLERFRQANPPKAFPYNERVIDAYSQGFDAGWAEHEQSDGHELTVGHTDECEPIKHIFK